MIKFVERPTKTRVHQRKHRGVVTTRNAVDSGDGHGTPGLGRDKFGVVGLDEMM